MLYQLNYFSKAKDVFTSEDLVQLGNKAAERNQKGDLTGLLMFKNGYFAQIIEGSRENLEALYAKIEKDSRHSILQEEYIQPVEQRSFPNWAMELKVVNTDMDIEYIRTLDHRAYYLFNYFKNYYSI